MAARAAPTRYAIQHTDVNVFPFSFIARNTMRWPFGSQERKKRYKKRCCQISHCGYRCCQCETDNIDSVSSFLFSGIRFIDRASVAKDSTFITFYHFNLLLEVPNERGRGRLT